MKNFIKLAAVGIAGYLIGFYEMKYKVVKVIAEAAVDDDSKKSQKAEESE